MNKKDKELIDGFLDRTEPKPKKKYNKKPRVLAEENPQLDEKSMRMLIIDVIILGISVIAIVAIVAFIVGAANGAHC